MHVPGHLREAFVHVVEDDPVAYDEVFHDAPMEVPTLLDRLSGCTDVMPRDLCESLELPPGCNYAMGVGALLKGIDVPDLLATWAQRLADSAS